MNRPIRLPKQTRNPSTVSDANAAGYRRRRGLCTAEQIVTLILKRYGLDEDLGSDFGHGTDEDLDTSNTVEAEIGAELKPAALTSAAVISNSSCLSQQQTFCWD